MDSRIAVAGILKDQMQQLRRTADAALRRDLVRAHFDALRQLNEDLHGMNLKMIEDVDNGRIVSDVGLKQRLQLDAEIMSMQSEMLEAQPRDGGEHGSAARTRETGAQR